MSDHEFDFELIMAIAEGTLPPEEAAAAERALDDEARIELGAQRAALAALADVASPTLTEAERMAMRVAVRTAINIGAAPTPAVPEAPSASPRYARWVPALAGVAVVMAVAAIGIRSNFDLSGFGIGGGDEASIAEAAPTITVAADEAADVAGAARSAGGDDAAESQGQLAGVEEDFAAQPAAEAASIDPATDGAGAAYATTVAAADLPPQAAIDLGAIDSDDPAQVEAAIEEARTLARSAFPYTGTNLSGAASAIDQSCWLQLEGDVGDSSLVVLTANATIDGQPGEVYVIDDGGLITAYLYRLDDCSLVTALELSR